MNKSIIIAGDRATGKTWLARSISNLFDDQEVLKLSPGHARLFSEKVLASESIRVIIVDGGMSAEDILYMENYLRHLFHLYPKMKGVIYVTNDDSVYRSNHQLQDFLIYTLSEPEPARQVPKFYPVVFP